jgi:UDP-N-acetylmuramoyl-L-alanyl-D-glutamate--2,6-diaminopimelate ligase
MEPVPTGLPFALLVDYAHTPDGLVQVLSTLRELRPEGRVVLVFGCGGDRDRSKRPEMGRAAGAADVVVVTSDNPRSEDPGAIIDAVLAGVPEGTPTIVEPDRRSAIAAALHQARPGDVVVVAGKGHEATQDVAGERRPFDDRAVARELLAAMGGGTA